MSIELLIGFFVSFFVSLVVILPFFIYSYINRLKETVKFLNVLMTDYMERMSKEPADDYPTELVEVLKKYYPRLPSYEKIYKYPISELIKMVDWKIDPHKYLSEKE